MLAEWMKEMRMLSKWMEEGTTDASRVDEGNANAKQVDALQRQNTEILKQIFPEKEYRVSILISTFMRL
jgi:hypothetical protein